MQLLRIDSSARRNSVSRQLTAHFVEAWQQEHPDGTVIERDLATTALPHITDEWVQAIHTNPESLTAEQKSVLQLSDALVNELVQADTIVIGAPMYNFAIPAPLKAVSYTHLDVYKRQVIHGSADHNRVGLDQLID